MHLADVLRLRPVPAAAVFLALTRRCPLSCRHCSTSSMLTSAQFPQTLFQHFVDSFTPECRPELVLMSGGEALLRAALVERIAQRARAVGTRSYLLSGMYFVRDRRVPTAVQRAIDAVDHFSASLDVFHEEQVDRDAVLRYLGRLLDAGKHVSLQITGLTDDDPYLAGITAEVRERFGDRLPMVVGLVGAVGRAAEWVGRPGPADRPGGTVEPSPCEMAAWPLVSFDGWVSACCNQEVLDNGIPEHLRLGHASEGWPAIRERCLNRPMVRAIRLIGPQALAAHAGAPVLHGYCDTCVGLAGRADVAQCASVLAARPTTRILEHQVAGILQDGGPQGFMRRHGSRRYAELATLGAEG